jgi:hypothetical protein
LRLECWRRQADPNRIGTGEGSGAALIQPERSPRFLIEEGGPRPLWGVLGRGKIGAVLSMGIESGPDFISLHVSEMYFR